MASYRTPRQCLNRFEKTHGVMDLDDVALDETLEASDGDVDRDALLTPWKRGHRVALRSAFSH